MKIYRCKHCNNIIVHLLDSGVNVSCCGEDIQQLTANTTDAAQEKHVPVVFNDNGHITVVIGEVSHPMVSEHYIQFVLIETTLGHQIKYLNPGHLPKADFILAEGEELIATYEYCNLHGLWKK